MSGFIDLHTHMLPGLDDGAAEESEAEAILAAASQAGFSTVVATPHRIERVYDADDRRIDESVEHLSARAAKLDIELLSGAEYYLDDRFLTRLEAGPLFCLGKSNTVLVELPMMTLPSFFGEYAFRIRLKGYVPLLAHPERYRDIAAKPKQAEQLVEKGFLLQVNLGSFAGLYGRTVRKTARFLVEQGLAVAAASDIHSPGYAERIYGDGIAALRRVIGDGGIAALLSDGPKRLLESNSNLQQTDGETE
jgi:protein-tyrosine phosphatase